MVKWRYYTHVLDAAHARRLLSSTLGRGLGVAVGASLCGGEVLGTGTSVLNYYSLWPKDTGILTRLHSTDSNKGHMYTRLSKTKY